MTTRKSVVSNLRDSLSARRADRAERRQLERELATFRTADDQAELRAMLARHTAEEGAEMAAVLDRQLAKSSVIGSLTYPGMRNVA